MPCSPILGNKYVNITWVKDTTISAVLHFMMYLSVGNVHQVNPPKTLRLMHMAV